MTGQSFDTEAARGPAFLAGRFSGRANPGQTNDVAEKVRRL
jgi:hypothetical protein